ncbi:hypothetical protein [Nocardia sp. NPDC052566]|uniref:hypothetical protein n=1 Tax=Nocardia sp. NPDC052566 TaxID=3364330 RepID=UPI0037CB6A3E
MKHSLIRSAGSITPFEPAAHSDIVSDVVADDACVEPARSRRLYRFGGAGTVTVSLEDLNVLALTREARAELFEILDQLAELEAQAAK